MSLETSLGKCCLWWGCFWGLHSFAVGTVRGGAVVSRSEWQCVTSPQGLHPRPTAFWVSLGNLLNHSLTQFSDLLYADNSSTYHIELLNAWICLKFLGQCLAHKLVLIVNYYYNYFCILVFSSWEALEAISSLHTLNGCAFSEELFYFYFTYIMIHVTDFSHLFSWLLKEIWVPNTWPNSNRYVGFQNDFFILPLNFAFYFPILLFYHSLLFLICLLKYFKILFYMYLCKSLWIL